MTVFFFRKPFCKYRVLLGGILGAASLSALWGGDPIEQKAPFLGGQAVSSLSKRRIREAIAEKRFFVLYHGKTFPWIQDPEYDKKTSFLSHIVVDSPKDVYGAWQHGTFVGFFLPANFGKGLEAFEQSPNCPPEMKKSLRDGLSAQPVYGVISPPSSKKHLGSWADRLRFLQEQKPYMRWLVDLRGLKLDPVYMRALFHRLQLLPKASVLLTAPMSFLSAPSRRQQAMVPFPRWHRTRVFWSFPLRSRRALAEREAFVAFVYGSGYGGAFFQDQVV